MAYVSAKRFHSQWTPKQLKAFDFRYEQNCYIGGEGRFIFSQQIGLDSLTVRVWFKNHCAKSIRIGGTITDTPCENAFK